MAIKNILTKYVYAVGKKNYIWSISDCVEYFCEAKKYAEFVFVEW